MYFHAPNSNPIKKNVNTQSLLNSKRLFYPIIIPVIIHALEKFTQASDTGTQVLNNTRPFLHPGIVWLWMQPECDTEHKYHISSNTGTPEI